MKPVLVHFDDHAQLAFEVDRLADGRRVVYVPSAPDPRAGAVLVFDEGRVEPLPTTFVAAIRSLRALGRGCGRIQLVGFPRIDAGVRRDRRVTRGSRGPANLAAFIDFSGSWDTGRRLCSVLARLVVDGRRLLFEN